MGGFFLPSVSHSTIVGLSDCIPFLFPKRFFHVWDIAVLSSSILNIILNWPALTVVLSKALPLTARYFSPLPGLESRPGHVRKLPVTWG